MTNSIVLSGRLGADLELRSTQGGDSVTSLRIANNRRGDKVLWMDVSVWGKQAELCVEHLSKGSLVTVTGSLEPRSYEKDGKTVFTTEIRASYVDFGPKEGASGDGATKAAAPAPSRADDYQFTPDDTLPF
jgi:single-strand DNA-binding protein